MFFNEINIKVLVKYLLTNLKQSYYDQSTVYINMFYVSCIFKLVNVKKMTFHHFCNLFFYILYLAENFILKSWKMRTIVFLILCETIRRLI